MSGRDPFDLSGTTAVVTGASAGGLGIACARSLAEAGARVLISDHPGVKDELEAAAAEINALWKPADVTVESDIAALRDHALRELGGVDALVHAAGIMQRKPTLDTSFAEWQRVIDVNLTGTWLVNRAFAAPMIEQGHGRIVNTSSIYAAIVGPLPEPAYYASKAGVANLTRGLAAEWGRSGITVNCLAPGVFYPTRMTAALAEDPGRLASMEDRTMLGRLGDPAKDIGGSVVWLCSPAAAYVTGQVIYLDGGWSAW